MPRLSQAQADEILSLPLNEILEQNGYFYKREKNSRNYLTMTNENSDTIIISRQNDGHYLYFNPQELTDKGNIFSFCKNRGISYKELLNNPNKVDLSLMQHKLERNSLKDENQKHIDAFKELKELNSERNYLVNKRYINANLLINLDNIKEDKYKNICIATYALKEFKDEKLKLNKTLLNQCGFVSYLKAPMKKDKTGKALQKPIKQICYGNKGLEIIKSKATKDLNAVKHIILAESSIDSLSVFEIKDFKADDTLLCATKGQLTPKHKEVLQYLESKLGQNATLYLAFDNDTQGQNFATQVKESLKTIQIQILKPMLKDFNDDLFVMKYFDLSKNFNAKDIQQALEPLNNVINEHLERKDILFPLPKIKGLKEATNTQEKLLYFKAKVENFIDFSQSNKAISNLDKEINKELSKIQGKTI